MTEHPMSDETPVTPDRAPGTAQTAGQLLKAARLRAGVHLAVLSVTLKIPVRQLEALEADQYPMNESPVFVRAVAASVCRQLRIDPAPVLALLPHGGTYLEPHGAVRQAHVRPADFGRMRDTAPRIPVRALWPALGMLVMIMALIWLPAPSQWAWLNSVSAHFLTPDPEVRTVTSAPDAQLQSPAAAAAPLDAVPVMPTVSASATPSAADASLVPELLFTATESSLIEVRGAQNQVLWSGVLKPGETSRVPAPQTVQVVIGRADAIQVVFKGQTLDLKPHTKINVARFEVKP